MRSNYFVKNLMGASSMVALSVGVAAVPAQQASAQTGVYGGGSSLSSEFFRQVENCYSDLASGLAGDSGTPGLASLCTAPVSGSVETLFASVGSGRGQQAYFTDDPTQLVNGGTQATGAGVTLPGTPPVYIDGNSTSSNFNSYPYPELEYAASDSPLKSTVAALTTTAYTYSNSVWATANSTGIASTTAPAVSTVFNASYNAATYGQPIQLPAFEVPVALGVNTSGMTTVKSANQQPSTGASFAGNAIQLDTAQVCAIFSGQITDWSSVASISKLTSSGLTVEAFDAANVNTSRHSTAAPYSTTSLPIHVIYRSDGSGTSFIMTNYLQSACPQLDNGAGSSAVPANHYSLIFGATNLPSTNFSLLLANIVANGGSTANFTGETGTQNVALTINTDSTHGGNIGYVSNDFTSAYSTLSGAPQSAAIQDESDMENGNDLPSQTTFEAPTPANADTAFSQLATLAPNTSSTFNDWNVYSKAYSSGTLSGKSILGVSNQSGAYPIVGTTFLMVYSCYNSNKITKVTNFLNWYFDAVNAGATPQAAVAEIANAAGFHTLTTNWSEAVYNNYLSSSSSQAISQGNTGNCAGIPGA